MSFEGRRPSQYLHLLPGLTPGSPRVLLSLLLLACTMDHQIVAGVPGDPDEDAPTTPYTFGSGGDETDDEFGTVSEYQRAMSTRPGCV